MRRTLLFPLQLALEAVFLLALPLAYLPMPFLRTTQRPGRNTRVVIVFTWIHKTPPHWFWRRYLGRRGTPAALLYIPLNRVSLRTSAEVLARYLEEYNLRNVTLVGISTGGLTCLLYLQGHDGWERTTRFISVATPFRGTPWARLSPRRCNLRELTPRSAIITDLAGQHLLYPDRVACIRAALDELVPWSSSCLPGAVRHTIPVAGHNVLHLACKATYDAIAQYATAPVTENMTKNI